MRSFKSLVFAGFLLPLAACGLYAGANESRTPAKPKAPLIFKVIGQAQASPDYVTIRFDIYGEGDTLKKAEQQMKKTELSVTQAVEKEGLNAKEMQLESFAAAPLQPGGISSALKPLGYRIKRGYRITVPATSESIGKILNVADAALTHGARPASVSGAGYDPYGYGNQQPSLMQFTIKDPQKLVQQAMDNGLAHARKLAERAAQDMGYPASSLRLISVHLSDDSANTGSCDSPGDRIPSTSSSWHPIKAVVCVEAQFDVK